MAVTILSGSQHFTQPREYAVAADELEYLEEPRAHSLAGHGDASGVNQQAGFTPRSSATVRRADSSVGASHGSTCSIRCRHAARCAGSSGPARCFATAAGSCVRPARSETAGAVARDQRAYARAASRDRPRVRRGRGRRTRGGRPESRSFEIRTQPRQDLDAGSRMRCC